MIPAKKIVPPAVLPIFEKVLEGRRISDADAALLFACDDLNALAAIANILRERKNGNVATYIRNLYVNYSNHCVLACEFCAFGARRRDAHAFEFSIEEIVEKVRAAVAFGVTEVHIVGGLHPSLPGEWYLTLLRTLRALAPDLFIKAFTAIEIRHFAERIFKRPLLEVLETFRAAGLGALTGGGAEIFAPAVRSRICRGKESAEEWLEVHRLWHELGMPSTATMLFGHVETFDDRIDHLRRLRELQDATHGFTAFIPFAFEPQGARPGLQNLPRVSAHDELKNLAVSRIYLDNFDHLTAYWVSMGLPLASVALNYGVDDLHGTIEEERIFHMAGATTPQGQSVASLEKAIREAGREPVARDTAYRRLGRVHGTAFDPAVPAAVTACA